MTDLELSEQRQERMSQLRDELAELGYQEDMYTASLVSRELKWRITDMATASPTPVRVYGASAQGMIPAIRELMAATGIGLKAAKDTVLAWRLNAEKMG